MKYQAGLLQEKGASSFVEILGTAIIDTIEMAKRLKTPLLILGILYVVGLLTGAMLAPDTGGATGTAHDGTLSVSYKSTGGSLFVLILGFFVVAEAVRTIVPEFRMTAGRFFSLLGWSLLTGLTIGLGFVCLVIPGFWLLGKLMPASYIVLLRPNENPFGASWHATKGLYWPTMGMILGVAMVCATISGLAGAFEGVAGSFALMALPLGPLAFALQALSLIIASLAYVRWTNELLLARDAGGLKALTPTQAAGIVP